jgi:hypothetical protein
MQRLIVDSDRCCAALAVEAAAIPTKAKHATRASASQRTWGKANLEAIIE